MISVSRARRRVRAFCADEDGASLVEFALVITLFLFLLMAIIDFGRIGHAWVGANKATQLAARIAAVRPPACPNVPVLNERVSLSTATYGSLCRVRSDVCKIPVPAVSFCQGTASNATALEIFTAVRPLLPQDTRIDQMRYTYAFDPNLGFLGGPYVPMVTVEFTGVNFTFISPLRFFVTAWTGQSSTDETPLTLPGMSVSLPGEDLALGMDG